MTLLHISYTQDLSKSSQWEMQKPVFPLKLNIQTESVRLSVPALFFNLEIPVLFLSTVMSMNSRLLSTSAEPDSQCWIILLEKSHKKVEGADPTTDFRCFENATACLSWPKGAHDCHHVPTQGVRAAYSSVTLSPTHHIFFTILAEKLCFMTFLLWQQPHNPYGCSRIWREEVQLQLKWHHYSIHLFLRRWRRP